MAKVHYRDGSICVDAPYYEKEKWIKRDEWGAACGYIRKNTTYDKEAVTCFYCKRELQRRNCL